MINTHDLQGSDMKMHHLLIALGLLYSFPAQATDNSGKWTEDQVRKLCQYRAEKNNNDAAMFERCVERFSRKVGQDKNPGMVTELGKADAEIAKKAQEKIKEKEQ
jgi:hypothetical protein